MKLNIFIIVIFLLFISPFANAQIIDFDLYSEWAIENFEAENTGLTSLPVLLIPMGGSHVSMGTATSGVALDSSFIESNSSMSSRLEFTELSVFHRNWIADSAIDSIAYTTRLENLGLGSFLKFLHVPFTEYDRYGRQESSVRYTETVAGLNISYNFFESFDFDGVSLGITPKFGFANISEQLYSEGLGNQNTSALILDTGISTSFDIFKHYPSRRSNTHIGITVQNIGMTSQTEPLPSRTKFGIGYYSMPWLLSSFDIIFPFTLDNTPSEPTGWAVGSSINVTDFFTISQGFYIQGGNPRFSLGSDIDFEDVELDISYTFDLATQAAPDRFSVGTTFSLGDRGREERQSQVEELYLDSLTAIQERNLERAETLLNHALEINDGFTPARETLEIIETQQELEEKMLSIKLDEYDEAESLEE